MAGHSNFGTHFGMAPGQPGAHKGPSQGLSTKYRFSAAEPLANGPKITEISVNGPKILEISVLAQQSRTALYFGLVRAAVRRGVSRGAYL